MRTATKEENPAAGPDDKARKQEYEKLFRELQSQEKGSVTLQKLLDRLTANGISENDPRLEKCLHPYLRKENGLNTELDQPRFTELLQEAPDNLLGRAIERKLAIPDFMGFKKDIEEIYNETKHNTEGRTDSSLPHPKTEGPPAFAVSICTTDGQILQLGHHELAFSIQSICKPINYAIALEDAGEETLLRHVGVEPGSESFDTAMILNEKDLPHNPLINSGAIMTSSLIRPEDKLNERLKYVMDHWEGLCGDKPVSYKEESFVAERESADKNFALAYLMQERGAFPENTDLNETINFYLKCCAIEVGIDSLAHAAATLANYGVCPSTGKKVFKHDTVRNTLSLMFSCGMYDHSGEFAFKVGLPAKSGIAGGLMVVIPNLMGIAIYSPPLDAHGNSVRGINFCEKLVEKFNFHAFDAAAASCHGKKDPRL